MNKRQRQARILAATADTIGDFDFDFDFGGLDEVIGDGITVEDPRTPCLLDLIWEAAGENPEGWREVTA
jgi:hypothetical protein